MNFYAATRGILSQAALYIVIALGCEKWDFGPEADSFEMRLALNGLPFSVRC